MAALAKTLEQEYEVLQLSQLLEGRVGKGQSKLIADRLSLLLEFISQEKELSCFQEEIFEKAMFMAERFLASPYLKSRYRNLEGDPQTGYEAKVVELYHQVVAQKNRLKQLYHNSSPRLEA